ncbi:class I SAM-dependent methyltransferase [Snodgrassella gandavensis]|uniref:class I SAM-dependent methyltransferase n=1 Tax=Snodgrassella gandavensis TaxID=2946698 RepID=UPI001EF5FC75|nr:methyltransferase domain-containing protein [Snodgrassella gandavensis]
MSYPRLENWLAEHAFGLYLSQLEQQFIWHKLSVLRFGTIMQYGLSRWQFHNVFAAESQYIVQSEQADRNVDIVADSMALPWAQQSMDTIIWPHGLDMISSHDAAIEEMARVLVPGGHIILTGLNVQGYWRLFYQRSIHSQPALNLLSASAVVSRMQHYGLYLEEGKFMGYGIPACFGKNHQAIEYMGNRWWPHLAAVYGLVLVKRTVPLTLTPQNAANPGLNSVTNMALNGIECN